MTISKFLLLGALVGLFAHDGRAQAYVGVSGLYSPSLGYKFTPSVIAMVQSPRAWETLQAGPLGKSSVDGGYQVFSRTEVGVLPVRGAWLTGTLGTSYMNSPRWNKTTVSIGPGVRKRFSDGTQAWGLIAKDFVTPNGGVRFSGGVQAEQGHVFEVLSVTVLRFMQPFVTPAEYGRWGTSVTVGVGWKF